MPKKLWPALTISLARTGFRSPAAFRPAGRSAPAAGAALEAPEQRRKQPRPRQQTDRGAEAIGRASGAPSAVGRRPRLTRCSRGCRSVTAGNSNQSTTGGEYDGSAAGTEVASVSRPSWHAFLAAFVLAASLDLRSRAATTERVVVNRYTGLAIDGFDPVAYFVDAAPRQGRAELELRFARRHLAVPQRRQPRSLRRRPRGLCAALRRLRSDRGGARRGDARPSASSG